MRVTARIVDVVIYTVLGVFFSSKLVRGDFTCYACNSAAETILTGGKSVCSWEDPKDLTKDMVTEHCTTRCYKSKSETRAAGTSIWVYTRGCEVTKGTDQGCNDYGDFTKVFGIETGTKTKTCACTTTLCNTAIYTQASVIVTLVTAAAAVTIGIIMRL